MNALARPPRRRPARAAFTVLEMLVSVGLTALLTWGTVALYTAACNLAATAHLQAELATNGRAALDLMARDLERLAPLPEGYLHLEAPAAPAECARVAFAAPLGPNGELAHVAYEVRPDGMLWRLTSCPLEAPAPPAAYQIASPTGVHLQALSLHYVAPDGKPTDTPRTWAGADALPRALTLTCTVRDTHARATVTLSTGALILAAGH